MFALSTFVWLALSSFVSGTFIGAVGVGGVLLIPALIYLAGLDVHQAMATALASFVATGVVGTIAFQRRGSIKWRITLPVCAGALLFGFFGAMANSHVNAQALSVTLALVIVMAGVYTLAAVRGMPNPVLHDFPRAQLALLFAVGAFVGFGSGLTGGGGPVFSVPIMIVLGFPPLLTIGTSQVVSILASGSGTIGNLTYGAVDFHVVGLIVVFEVVGVLLGAKIVHAVNQTAVRRFVAWLCVVVGLWMIVKAIW